MKQKRMKDSKLRLNKQTIAHLDEKEMSNVNGGAVFTIIIKVIIDTLIPAPLNQSADLYCASIESCATGCYNCPVETV